MSSKCECFLSQLHYLKWPPECKGLAHCPRAKKDQTTGDAKIGPGAADEIIAKDAEEIAESRANTSAVAKVAEIAEPRVKVPIAKVVVSAAKKVEGVEKKCECFGSQLKNLKCMKYLQCKGLAHCPTAKKDKIVCDTKAAPVAAVQPDPVRQDRLISLDEEVEETMEEKIEQTYAKKKLRAKLELLEKEVKLGHQVLAQTKTLLKSKKALLRRKVRVNFNKCHKFWRGDIISMHKSFVDEQVDAAKARLGLGKRDAKFDIDAMVAKIDELAPGAKYNSAEPPPPSMSTPRPRFQTFAPRRICVTPTSPRRTRSLAVPAPPVLGPALAEESTPRVPLQSSWYRGDQCIIPYDDAIDEDLCYDNPTQLEQGSDATSYKEEEVDIVDSDLVCEDCGFADADVVTYNAEGEDGDHYEGEDYAGVDFAEDADFSDGVDYTEIYFAEDDADVFYYCAEGEDGDFADGDNYDEVISAEDDSVGDYSN